MIIVGTTLRGNGTYLIPVTSCIVYLNSIAFFSDSANIFDTTPFVGTPAALESLLLAADLNRSALTYMHP
jgi:hypothetical protein